MFANVRIRKEKDTDIEAITKVTKAAFKNVSVSNQTEHFIIKALRKADALSISLVAEFNSQVVGHIAFSPISISDGTKDWYALGPLAVLPRYQRRGIGTKLINRGLALLKKIGAQGCALVGDPNYYNRFGFNNYPELIHEGVPQEVFLCLSFSDKIPQGNVVFHKGFKASD